MDIRSKEVVNYLNLRNLSPNPVKFVKDFIRGNHLVTVIGKNCAVTNKYHEVPVLYISFKIWRDGGASQFVFSELTEEEREIIQTGYTTAEWDEMFQNMKEEPETNYE